LPFFGPLLPKQPVLSTAHRYTAEDRARLFLEWVAENFRNHLQWCGDFVDRVEMLSAHAIAAQLVASTTYVGYWHKADMLNALTIVRFLGAKRTLTTGRNSCRY
jgi:hypothetical protein